jgi:NSS family neurotransmitter:Na+ symporter
MPNMAELTPNAVIYALGHAFFTLAIGAGTMLVYGSYLPKGYRIASNVCIIASLDVLVALLSGLAIFSIVFAYSLPPEGGPGLMFKVLPIAFSKMPQGQWIGGFFFLLLWFAAWASAISMAEPLVVLLMEKAQFRRNTAAILIGLLCWLLGLFALLSFNVWQEHKIFGFNLFDAMADLTTNILLPIGGLLFSIFAGWVINPHDAKVGLYMENPMHFQLWRFLIRYIVPLGIIITFIWNLI